MTIEETGAVMDLLIAAYPQHYRNSDQRTLDNALKLWAAMLVDHPVQDVLLAVKHFIATDVKGFPPPVGVIIDRIVTMCNGEQMSELEAWNIVKRAVSSASPYVYIRTGKTGAQMAFEELPVELQRIVGSPQTLVAWGDCGERELNTVIASNFQRSYRARAAYARELQALPSDVRNAIGAVSARMALPEGGE